MRVRGAEEAIVPPSNPTTSMTIAIRGAGRLPADSNPTHALASIARCAPIASAMVVALVLAPMEIAAAQRSAKSTVAGAGRSTADASPTPARSCFDTVATIVPARLDEKHLIYVEQETVVPNRDRRILVAGAPVYVWRDAGDRYDLLGLDSLFGMIIEPSSSFVRSIPSPLPGRVLKGMRAAALPDGWWLVTFAEVFSVQEERRPNVIAMWVGETDGSSWRAVEKLPAVSDTLDPLRFSALAMYDRRVRLTAITTRDWQQRVVLFSRDGGRWTVRSHDVGLSTHAAITATPSLDLLAVVRPDTTLREDRNSLFLYTKAPTDTFWTSHPRLWRGGDDPARGPLFVNEARQPLLLWETGPMFRATSAWALSLATIPDSTAAPIPMPAYASDLVASSLGDAGVIAAYDRGGPTRDIRVFEYHEPLRVSLVFSKPTEYRGLFGAALTPDRVVLIASKAGQPPRDPAVISMLETHAWRCPIADARSP
jgi:hypothetical protein